MFASTCVSPMDVSKTRLQVLSQGVAKGAPKPSLASVMSNILKNDGVKGLYAGFVHPTSELFHSDGAPGVS